MAQNPAVTRPARWAAALAVVVVMFLAAASASRPSTSAQVDPTVSVDALSDATNTSTTVGSIDTCRSVTGEAVFPVDVVIQGVTNISGFQANLLYDSAVLKVTSVNYNFLLGTTGAAVLDFGAATPDSDGDFLLAAAMFSLTGPTGASGDGVLARVTLQAVGPGSSPLNLTAVKLSDAASLPIPPVDASNFYAGPVNDASIFVDTSCSDADGDTIPDAADNCPTIANAGQQNTDADLGAAGATMAGTPIGDGLGDACDADDDDDSYSDIAEGSIGTQPADNCAGAPGTGGDAWPADFDLSQTVDILDIVQLTPPVFGSGIGDPNYSTRKDLSPDGNINILDIVLLTPPVFNSGCS